MRYEPLNQLNQSGIRKFMIIWYVVWSLVSLIVCQLWSNSEVLLSLPYQREKWFSTDTVDSMINEMLLVKLDKNPSLDARDKAEARSELTSFILCHRKASYRFHNNTESTFSAIHSQCKLARAPEAHHCNGLPNVSSIVADSLKSSYYAARSNRPGMMPTESCQNGPKTHPSLPSKCALPVLRSGMMATQYCAPQHREARFRRLRGWLTKGTACSHHPTGTAD